jgi:hypothetical protein
MPPKRKPKPKNPTPEDVAQVERKRTKCSRDYTPNATDAREIYSRKEFVKDYLSNDSKLADTPENQQGERLVSNSRDIANLGDKLIHYSMNPEHISFSGFFRLYQFPPSVLWEQIAACKELAEKYELARCNLAYNNEKKLAEKMTPHLAGKVAQFQSQFDAVRQRDRRAEKRFEEKNKLKVMRKLIKERKELDESSEGTKVSYEVVYDGQKVEV